MRDDAFYNAGCTGPGRLRKVVIPFRRLLRRLLRPILFRLAELFDHLGRELHELAARQRHQAEHFEAELAAVVRRQDELDRRMRACLALGWDYVALVRRLATLEERVELCAPEGPTERPDRVSIMLHSAGHDALRSEDDRPDDGREWAHASNGPIHP